jgi:hypothetical protein
MLPMAVLSESHPRAERFSVRTQVWYRAGCRPVWSSGETVNISRSGVLFQTEKEIEPGTLLEMRLSFPAEMTWGKPVELVCWGPVIRKDQATVAASILNYRFKQE